MARRGKNEGSIFKRSNGTWRAQVSIDGKRLSYTAKSRNECHEWIRKMLDQIDQGMTFEGRNLTLGNYIKDWITTRKKALRPRTGIQYELLITKYIDPNLGRIKLKDLNLRVFNRFYDKLVDQEVGTWNINYTHRVIHSALEDAVRDGILGRNPSHGATVPRQSYKEMKILSEQQVGQFLVVASTSRYEMLYLLAIKTGMRISELRGLAWSDIDWVKGTITVGRQIQDIPRKGTITSEPKTRSGTRTIKLGETTLQELRQHRQRQESEQEQAGNAWQDNNLLFPSVTGTPFSRKTLYKDFQEILKFANLPRIRFHDLRHTAASLMLNHGVPVLVVSKILGHSKPSVTLNVYAHCLVDMQNEAANLMDEIVTPIPVSLPSKQNVTIKHGE